MKRNKGLLLNSLKVVYEHCGLCLIEKKTSGEHKFVFNIRTTDRVCCYSDSIR